MMPYASRPFHEKKEKRQILFLLDLLVCSPSLFIEWTNGKNTEEDSESINQQNFSQRILIRGA